MTLYSYEVIYNPISDWITSFSYFVGNKTVNDTVSGLEYFQCILDHTSSGTNEPGDVGSWMTFWVQISPTSPNTDITSFIETIKEDEVGSGEVRSASLRFNAVDGAFITQTNSGATPIFNQFDAISVKTTDSNVNSTTTVYSIDILHPTKDGAVGTVLPVDLLGLEFYLQKTLFADQFFFKSMFFSSKTIIDYYNTNRGKDQPSIINHDAKFPTGFNNLPQWTANDYTFNLSEKFHYDGLIDIMDRGGSSVASGGAGDFFEVGFQSNPDNADQLLFRAFSSGNPPDQTTIPIISNTLSINPAEQEGDIEAARANVTGTWSANGIGTLPRQNADFAGGLEAWRLFPEYVAGETYPKDAIIEGLNTLDNQGDDFHYKTNKDNVTSAPPVPPATSNTDWFQYQFVDFLATEVDHPFSNYSFWTDIRVDEWKSNGANTNGTLGADPPTDSSMKIWDSNQVKIDGKNNQTWVDVRALNFNAIPTPFKRAGGVFRGFRVLVDGTGTDEFANFSNMIIQWNGEQWLIFKRPTLDLLVGVDEESRTYQFNGTIWVDITTSLQQSNDVYHAVFNITNTQGHNDKSNGGGGNYGQTSAVTYEFRYKKGDNGVGFNTPSFYRQFAGVNFRVPFPFNTYNSNPEIGTFYGDNDLREPATFEAENMGLTPSGLTGFNNVESESLGPLDALTFFIRHEWRYEFDGTGGLLFSANYSYRCALYDIDDTVIIHDFVIPFNNLWEHISLPIGEFKTYKARAAWAFGNAAQNVFLDTLEILPSFRYRNIKKIAIHWLGPYDDQGRFNPNGQLDFLFPSILDTSAGLFTDGYNIKLSIDSFQWIKPGLSLTPPNTDRPLAPQFFYEPLISNKYQADQANLAKNEIMKFQHKGYEITMVGRNTEKYGDSVFLDNPKLVNDADMPANALPIWSALEPYVINDKVFHSPNGFVCIKDNTNNVPPDAEFWTQLNNPIPNTIKLVVKKITRLIDKTPSGPGGYLTTLTTARRFKEGEE